MYQGTALGERSWGCTMGEWAKEGSAVCGEGKETNEGCREGKEKNEGMKAMIDRRGLRRL